MSNVKAYNCAEEGCGLPVMLGRLYCSTHADEHVSTTFEQKAAAMLDRRAAHIQNVRDLIDTGRFHASRANTFGSLSNDAKEAYDKLARAVELLCDLG